MENDEIMTEVRQTQLLMNISPEYKYYIQFCGLFQGKRNCVSSWPQYESCFTKLMKADGELGEKRMMQTLYLYFVKFDPSKQKFIDTLMNKLYENSVLSSEFVLGWQADKIKSDKKCALYDRKSEKAFRPLLKNFCEWLR